MRKISAGVYASKTWRYSGTVKAAATLRTRRRILPRWNCSSGMWMTLLEQSEGSRVVFSRPPILFIQICSPLSSKSAEKTNWEDNLPFLDFNMNVSQDRGVTCSWYQKPTNTGTILNYRSCAPIQYERSVIQGTVPRVFYLGAI